MKIIKRISLLLVITSCGISFSDVKFDLGHGYYYLGEGESQSYMYYTYNLDKPSIDKIIIWPTVLSYDYNANFIIIKQSPNRAVIRQNLIYFRDISEMSVDSILNNDAFFNNMFSFDTCYWIINKKDKALKGPFSISDYIKEKEYMGISEELHLK